MKTHTRLTTRIARKVKAVKGIFQGRAPHYSPAEGQCAFAALHQNYIIEIKAMRGQWCPPSKGARRNRDDGQ
jgi:hypothetical protein